MKLARDIIYLIPILIVLVIGLSVSGLASLLIGLETLLQNIVEQLRKEWEA